MDTVLVFTEPDLARGDGRPSHAPPPRSTGLPAALAVVTGAAVFGICGLLDAEQCADLPERRFAPGTPVDPDAHLDAVRARRLDRAARLAAVAVQHALANANAPAEGTGVVLGSAYGNVDGSAAFMHRVFEKGPRAASPAEFPNLVPSSFVGHVSIYLGLRGPAFATADLAVSGESALTQASQLIVAGEAVRLVAGAVEPKSEIVENILSALFAHTPSQAHAKRADLAAAVVLESEREAGARGARVLARVRQLVEWRGAGRGTLDSLRAPQGSRAEVILSRANGGADALLAQTPWKGCAQVVCAPALGESDGLGAVAVSVAVGRIATRHVDEVLVLGVARGRGFAIVLTR